VTDRNEGRGAQDISSRGPVRSNCFFGSGVICAVAFAAQMAQAAPAEDWRADAPGHSYHISASDLPAPYATASSENSPTVVSRPAGAKLSVPAGFVVQAVATHLEGPRAVRVAPNGDIFIAETGAGRIRVLRMADGTAVPSGAEVFAAGLDGPFGIAFYPVGANPRWLYVATNNQVLRFAYHSGLMRSQRAAEVIVAKLADTVTGHTTRDLVFSNDGARMFVSVGSGSNIAADMPKKSAAEARQWEVMAAPGAGWAGEANRADVLAFNPDGQQARIFATGIRNCAGLAIQPASGSLWCATNERDGLGDDLVPDYATRVREHGFYGWPWYYIGAHEDPRHAGERPDLADQVVVPDVLFQAHSASLTLVFYAATSGAAAFAHEYLGDAFVALHGSWNRSRRTGSKVVRLRMKDGVPTGEYEDFLTGFVIDNAKVWGRPVGVAVAHDGALLVSDDAGDRLWRVTAVK